jgi:hypothetical protein
MNNVFTVINNAGLKNAFIWSIVGCIIAVVVALAVIALGLPIWAGVAIGLATDIIWDFNIITNYREGIQNIVRNAIAAYTPPSSCDSCTNYSEEEESEISEDYPQEESEDEEILDENAGYNPEPIHDNENVREIDETHICVTSNDDEEFDGKIYVKTEATSDTEYVTLYPQTCGKIYKGCYYAQE